MVEVRGKKWLWGIVASVGTFLFFSFWGLFDNDLPMVWVGWGIMLGTGVALTFVLSGIADWMARRKR